MKFLKWLGIIVGGLIVIGIVGSILGDDNTKQQVSQPTAPAASTQSKTEPAQEPAKKSNLEVIESSIQKDGYISYIVGSVKNNSSKQYSYVQVEINLYDNSGAQVGSTLANANNLEPGAIWKFKAVVTEENATKYKIKDITGF